MEKEVEVHPPTDRARTRNSSILAQHIDDPGGQRHRLVLLDPSRLRCHDCQRTLLLTQPSPSTSTSPIPGPGDPRCPKHHHEHASGCRPCASDAKAQPDDTPTKPLAGWANTSHPNKETPCSTPAE